MPYIKQEDRKELDLLIKALCDTITTGGELNYTITKLVLDYSKHNTNFRSYGNYAEALGHLEASKLEFYRRAISPYEDSKIVENGDVY